MKILHAVSGWPPEQARETESYVRRLAREQTAGGHAVAIAAGSASDRYGNGFRRTEGGDDLPVYRVSRHGSAPERWEHGASPYVARVFGELLRAAAPDLVHVHDWSRLSRTIVRRAARAGIPSVVTLHDAAVVCPRSTRVRPDAPFCELAPSVANCLGCVPRETWVSDEVVAEQIGQYYADMQGELHGAALLLVPSRAHGRLLATHSDLPEQRFEVLPLPSAVVFDALPGERWRRGAGRRLRLAHWGGLSPEEGTATLLSALRRLKRSRELELVLWGPNRPELEQELAALPELAVERRLAYATADLCELRADLAVLPALRHEPHGVALDVALALRLPLIVSDRGALAERAGAGALAFPAGDAAGLAARLAQVLDDPDRLAGLAAGLPRMPSIEEHWTALEPLYRRALSQGGTPAPREPHASEADDRERWERVARAFELLGRDLAGLRASAEEEVKGLRSDASDAFARLQEELANAARRAEEVRTLKARAAARSDELREAEHRAEERSRQLAEAQERLREREDRLVQAERLHLERERWLQRRLEEEVAHREHRIWKLHRENRLAMPLVWPARAVLWLWDRARGGPGGGSQGKGAT